MIWAILAFLGEALCGCALSESWRCSGGAGR
jgi:hypothetical protein